MPHVFGPVRSRRLGRSLGLDVVPQKICNWNCVYCQLGRTVPVTNVRREYRSTQILASDIRKSLQNCREDIDWITLVGSGEPTLHVDLGQLIREVKEMTDTPVAVITNGSLLHMPEVARDLAAADAVLPSLDAGSEPLYLAINRPHPQLTFDSLRRGLTGFRQSYHGRFWVEVMLVGGMNDGEPAPRDLTRVLQEISPDEVHISTPFRAAAEPWVHEPPSQAITRARELFGDKACVMAPAAADVKLGNDNPIATLTDVIMRHPLSEEEVRTTLAGCLQDPDEAVQHLAQTGRLQRVYRQGRWFWCPAGAAYADGETDVSTEATKTT
jgi:wyosine [tRNA(Phe)-imidazoG37] synthetase (radical SAM superfamily)